MINKKKYEQPLAFDMSQGMIHGQKVKPLGLCTSGVSVSGATCTTGTRVTPGGGVCDTGLFPDDPYCSPGSGGSSGCKSGSTP